MHIKKIGQSGDWWKYAGISESSVTQLLLMREILLFGPINPGTHGTLQLISLLSCRVKKHSRPERLQRYL